MNIMRHRRRFVPASGGRTPGGVDHAIAVDETLPPLLSAGQVTVGVIDTGLVLEQGRPHSWFGDHVSFRPEEADQLGVGGGSSDELGFLADADGHGTFVAGLILREAPTARVIMRGVLDQNGGSLRTALGPDDDELVADALLELASHTEVQVINLSFAGGVFDDEKTAPRLAKALDQLKGTVAVVAAAGNSASDQRVWPAAFPGVISVGALDETRPIAPGTTPPRARFSNYGPWVKAYAGGVRVLGPFVTYKETGETTNERIAQDFHGWARWSGTSFAAATVSGRIAQHAIERGTSGAQAADELLLAARKMSEQDTWYSFTGSAGAAVIL